MEDRCKGTQGVSTRGLDLAHDIDQDGTRLTDGHLDVRTLIVSAQMAAHLVLSGRDRETCHMHRTVVGHIDITIGRDRQLFASLGIAIDIDDELVTRTQHIVLRGGNVHHRLEGQVLVVEDIATEDFLALFLRTVEIHGVGTLVHSHHGRIGAVHPLGGAVHHHLLLTKLLGIVVGLNLTEGTVVLTHTVSGIAQSLIGNLTHTRLLQLTGIFLAHILNLLQSGTFFQQLCGNIALGLAQFLLLHDILQDLRVTHTLSKGCQSQAQEQKRRE